MSICTAANTTPKSAVARPSASSDHAPPPERRVQQVEAHAQQAVDRGLEHHAAHQRRHRRGRGRVRLGQPDVQRQRCPALAPKPNSASRKATEAQNGDSCCARMLAKV